MNRKQFINHCTFCLVGGSAIFLQQCRSSAAVNGTLVDSDLTFQMSEFRIAGKQSPAFRRFVVVHHERLEYPVAVYRHDDDRYSAVLLRCTHQGTVLQAFDEKLHCPAHGSEFNVNGSVDIGPSVEPLRTLSVIRTGSLIKISLT